MANRQESERSRAIKPFALAVRSGLLRSTRASAYDSCFSRSLRGTRRRPIGDDHGGQRINRVELGPENLKECRQQVPLCSMGYVTFAATKSFSILYDTRTL